MIQNSQSSLRDKAEMLICGRKVDDSFEIGTNSPPYRIFTSVTDIPQDYWDHIVPPSYTSLRPEMLEALERAEIPNMESRYVLFFDKNQPIGFAYFQLISFSISQIKSFTKSPPCDTSIRTKILAPLSFITKKILEKFRVKLLVNGNSFLTGEHGIYIKEDFSREKARELILDAINDIQKEAKKIKGVLLKDGISSFGFENQELKAKGFRSFATDPNMIFNYRKNWSGYDDYLLDMSSKYRQRAKSAIKKSKKLRVKALNLADIKTNQERMFELFSGVLSENKFMLTELSPDYFAQLKERLKDDFGVFGYYLNEKMVAFHTVICHHGYCEAHYLGYETSLNREMKLYQRMLYDIIKLGFKGKLDAISFGRTAMEIKSSVGAEPELFPCYLKINNRLINFLSSPVLANINLDNWQPRHPFKD